MSLPLLETRSIDLVPDAERHGGLGSQFTLWMAANLQITAVVTGALAVVFGGDVVWSLVGLLLGQLLGGTVMALHAAQGPQLGLPQMISSRAQFGVHGANIPIAAVLLMYVGFSASGCVLAGQAVARLLGTGEVAGILLFAASIVVVTLFGYRVIHGLGRVATAVGVLAFAYLFVRLLGNADAGQALGQRHFDVAKFLLAVSLSASWQIAYGPYVADYSRYLPRSVPSWKVFAAVGGGSVLGSQVSMAFGVFAAALAGQDFAGHEVQYVVGLGATGTAALLLYFAIAFGKVTVTSLNAYGSFMSAATLLSAMRPGMRFTARHRMVFVVAMVALVVVLALVGRHSFLQAFQAFILALLAVFTPWSAINLVDYYAFMRSRHYDAQALADPDGCYGRWNWTGITIYLIGIVVQVPFLSTSFHTGSLVARLGGVDYSWIVGLVVPAVLYYVARRAGVARHPG